MESIDYLSVLDYIKNNAGVDYSNPESNQISEDEKKQFLKIKKDAQNAVEQIKNMAHICKKNFKLDKCETIHWLDGSKTKTKKYLWLQMKYLKYSNNPISISIFVEMFNSKPVYRFSLEIKNDGSDTKQLEQYHNHLNLPLKDKLIYVCGDSGKIERLDESADIIRQKIDNKIYSRVQICKILEFNSNLTNDDCEKAMLNAIGSLIPYYEYVLYNKQSKFKTNNEVFSKNLILCGPPGTGKTYKSAIYAVAICEGKSIDELSAPEKYDEVMFYYNKLKKENRIAFTTFHQSYGYEEFIEGIKPVVSEENKSISYEIQSGIFKSFCDNARKSTVKTDKFNVTRDATVWKVTIKSDVIEDCFKNNRVRINWGIDSDGAASFANDMKSGDIIITTDGSRRHINGICVVTNDDAYCINTEDNKTTRDVLWLAKNIDEDITTINNDKILHRMTVARVPAIQISDIVTLAKNKNPELSNTKIEENEKPYVFIIDEINRGNISKIFGELITLIEVTKREGAKEAINAILPYSGTQFSVPNNVYILGTMNTADRSIALMDTALRRRFDFIEMMPDSNVLRKIGADKVGNLDVAKMLDIINERIAFLYDREHTIGHAFFTCLKDDNSLKKLKSIFEKSVIPLLQEYFYEDYQKIQMVLGDNGKDNSEYKFILDERLTTKSLFKGDIEDVIELPEKKYLINKKAFYNIESYIQII